MGADGFVGVVADAAFDAVVDAVVASRAEGLVVIGGDAKSSAQLFVEAAEIAELVDADGDFQAFVGEQEFLVAGVPEVSELAIQHDRGNDGHVEAVLGFLAKFGAAIVFLDADDAAGVADKEALGRERFDLWLGEDLVDVPHGHSGYEFGGWYVKAKIEAGPLALRTADKPDITSRRRGRRYETEAG